MLHSPKRLLALIAPLALFAALFVAPAMANAAQLTQPAGVTVPVGTTITGTSTNAVTTTEAGNLECAHVEVHGIVRVNNGSLVVVEMEETEGTDTAEGCHFGTSPTLVKPTLLGIEAEGESGAAAFSFEVLTEAGFLPEGSESEVTWVSGTDSIHVQGPVEGFIPGEFHGDFTLSHGGNPVLID